MQSQLIADMQELDEVWEQAADRHLLIFKHSTRCPTSAWAHEEYQNFLEAWEGGDHVIFRTVRVVEERPVSQEIARRAGVTHQSPQALLLHRGEVVWLASHGDLTEAAFAEAVPSRAPSAPEFALAP